MKAQIEVLRQRGRALLLVRKSSERLELRRVQKRWGERRKGLCAAGCIPLSRDIRKTDSFARAESLSDMSESMLTSRSCGPVMDVSAAPGFPDLEEFAEAEAEAFGAGRVERFANADTGGVG